MTSWEKFDECQLPSIDHFYSSLTNDSISQKDYEHAQHVFETCRLNNMGDYHNLYLKTDVLLLADVYENFRDMSQKYYDLDPCHFYTSPGLSWQAMLKMTSVTLELMTDIDQILFIEKGIRGGISQISNRYKKQIILNWMTLILLNLHLTSLIMMLIICMVIACHKNYQQVSFVF